jgi:hypothetical protein
MPAASCCGVIGCVLPFPRPPLKWTCTSINPGIRNFPRPSMTCAPAGGATACVETCAIRWPSTTTVAFGSSGRPVPSISVTPRMTSDAAGCWADGRATAASASRAAPARRKAFTRHRIHRPIQAVRCIDSAAHNHATVRNAKPACMRIPFVSAVRCAIPVPGKPHPTVVCGRAPWLEAIGRLPDAQEGRA